MSPTKHDRPLGRVIPDGKKIATLRKRAGFKQLVFSELCGLGERQYRSVERDNAPIKEFSLIEIATKLKVSPQELKLGPQNKSLRTGGPDISQGPLGLMQMRLKPVHGAALISYAERADWFDYHVSDDYDEATADLIIELLKSVRYKVTGWDIHKDAYDDEEFGDIKRSARAGKIVEELSQRELVVFANTYSRKAWLEGPNGYALRREVRLHIVFAKPANDEQRVYIEEDDVDPTKIARRYADLDDDIPF